jgi:hypothetical protein
VGLTSRSWRVNRAELLSEIFGVVPDEPITQLAIKLIEKERQLAVVIDQRFLNCSGKTVADRHSIGSVRIGVPMVCVTSNSLIEVLHELRAIFRSTDLSE